AFGWRTPTRRASAGRRFPALARRAAIPRWRVGLPSLAGTSGWCGCATRWPSALAPGGIDEAGEIPRCKKKMPATLRRRRPFRRVGGVGSVGWEAAGEQPEIGHEREDVNRPGPGSRVVATRRTNAGIVPGRGSWFL